MYHTNLTRALVALILLSAAALLTVGCQSNLDPPDPDSICNNCNWMEAAEWRPAVSHRMR
mgnify:FL=1